MAVVSTGEVKSVEVYLIRHGIATEREINTKDEERVLTEVGRQKTRKVATRLYQLDLRFNVILTSPLVRARQTAEILSSAGLGSYIQESSYLAPNGDINLWLRNWLDKHRTDTRLALVGHQPDLGEWAEILIWGEARTVIVLKKAGIIGLTLPETGLPVGSSQLFCLTSPKFLL